jgi:hypothetical protein
MKQFLSGAASRKVQVFPASVFSTHVHIMVQKIYFGSLFVAKFYFAFFRKAYFVVTYGSFYGSQFSPSYGSSHKGEYCITKCEKDDQAAFSLKDDTHAQRLLKSGFTRRVIQKSGFDRRGFQPCGYSRSKFHRLKAR